MSNGPVDDRPSAEFVGNYPPLEPHRPPPPRRPRVRRFLPLLLFIVTCYSTYQTGGLAFAAALMTTLTAHELGHYFQARRYHVPASLPYFIPMPISPIGTMGAVIAMRSGMGNRRSLFDIAISGPIAGLVPAIIFSWVGLQLSEVDLIGRAEPRQQQSFSSLGHPLLFKLLADATFEPPPKGFDIYLHPVAFAGWVGIFITGLNMIPIGQLDGGHILYALLRRKAQLVAIALLYAAMLAVVLFGYWNWALMLLILVFIGARHPPTADDQMPLGLGRTILGWISLLFIIVGFTPEPFMP